jgi:hypothetical protein
MIAVKRSNGEVSVARARTANGRYLKGIRTREAKVLDQYVSIVSSFPFVEQVLAVPGYEGVGVWTVIDAEPFADEPRDQIYDAELKAVLSSPDALVDFRLINRLEYGDQNTRWALPEGAYVAWRRAPRS